MTWNENRSRSRIINLLSTVPEANILVEEFGTSYRQRRDREILAGSRRKSALAIDDIPYNAVVLTDGVHVYANLQDYDVYLEELGRETESGCARLLEFVHLHYTGMDRLIEAFGAQRVDYHGGRVHAIIVEPVGEQYEPGRVRTALSLAAAMRALIAETSAAHQRRYSSRIRVGIESGRALAINSGRKGEPEPLFIGDAANLAAKLADGEEEGVVLGERARIALLHDRNVGVTQNGMLINEASYVPSANQATNFASAVSAAFNQFRVGELAEATRAAQFNFFRHDLPLKSIDFAKLTPHHSVRQEMVSIFADLSGFTSYVHFGMGSGQVRQVVSNLHVLRGEMAAVVRDFGGRKIRFIGDCIHSVFAEGDRHRTSDIDTVRKAVEIAGALRSSFELAQNMLPGIGDLGLAIGIELGASPITRLGIRGERNVRCASSKATTISEKVQRECGDNETALGDNALSKGPASVRAAFGRNGILAGLDYECAVAFSAAMSAPAIARAHAVPAEPHADC